MTAETGKAAERTIDEMARSCVMEGMHSHDPRHEIIAKHMRLALVAIAGPMRDLLDEIAGTLGGAAEGSDEEALLDRIGTALAAYDEAVGT